MHLTFFFAVALVLATVFPLVCSRPAHFPPLPHHPENQPSWSADVQQAYGQVSSAYNCASDLLRLEEYDPLRLRLHSERLFRRYAPLVQRMENEVGREWTLQSYESLLQLIAQLEAAAESSEAV